ILKVMVLGDAGVGKSHLSHLYARRQAVYTERPTAGFDFIATKLKVETGQEVKVQLLDTSGNEKYRTALLPHMAVASGALVVYSVSDRKSFEHVQSWIDNFSSKANKGSEPVMLLVGNKTDQERVVSTEEGRELAMKNGILFVETNTSNKPSVDEAFNLLIADTY
ncbi:small GTPase superfamily, partial [Gorgonomyces haynaldii]